MSNDEQRKHRIGLNAALFASLSNSVFLQSSLQQWLQSRGCYLLTNDENLLPQTAFSGRLGYFASLSEMPEVGSDKVLSDLNAHCAKLDDLHCLVVDMRWSLNVAWGGSMVERWGGLCQQFADTHGVAVISLYDRETLVEDQLAAAFRVHQTFVSPSGQFRNPHWLPEELITSATVEDQLGFLLGQIVPEYANAAFHSTPLRDAARGATPTWVRRSRHSVATEPANTRWHVHCLGQLRVFVAGSVPVDWAIKGSAPRKSRALFAYLLNRAENGASADELAEFLWPENAAEDNKRARLRHAIAMLRKSLGGSETVDRTGDNYRLNIPQGSWIDIRSFEQLCRRGLALFRHNQYAEAIRVYEAAEGLYAGDLFDDLPNEYADSEFDDWCLPKRIWLREMAVKLQYDMSKVLRQQGRLREALDHSQKALKLDSVNDSANIEFMRVLAEQGRYEAIVRQYQQYLQAIDELDKGNPSAEVRMAYQDLMHRADIALPKQKPNGAH
jgi:DNA-binding SARP family transcriptional activator